MHFSQKLSIYTWIHVRCGYECAGRCLWAHMLLIPVVQILATEQYMYRYTLHEWFWTSCSFTPCLSVLAYFMFHLVQGAPCLSGGPYCENPSCSSRAVDFGEGWALGSSMDLTQPWSHGLKSTSCSNRSDTSGETVLFDSLTQLRSDKKVVPLKMSECACFSSCWVLSSFPFWHAQNWQHSKSWSNKIE